MNPEKRIVLVSPAYPYRGGQALVESHLNYELTKAGMDCHTVSFTKLYPDVFFPGKTQYEESKSIFNPHSDKIYRILNSINPFTWWKAYRKIKELQPTHVVFVWWMPFFAPCYATICFLLRWFAPSIQRVFLVENYISHEKRWMEVYLNKLTLNFANYFICESGFVQKSLRENHPDKEVYQTTLSVYDHFDQKQYTRETARSFFQIDTEHVILFFGLIRKYKGLDQLLEAIPLLQHQNITLLIAGECYENQKEYEQKIIDLGIQQKTKCRFQFIANEEVEPYFKAADLICLPYHNATQSGILMMAYGFGKPVVVTRVGGLPELVKEGKTGVVVQNNTPATLAAGIDTVLDKVQTENMEQHIRNLNTELGYQGIKDMFQS
jgi:glycosyltransferase involved in cell wall biosynthesis